MDSGVTAGRAPWTLPSETGDNCFKTQQLKPLETVLSVNSKQRNMYSRKIKKFSTT